MLTNTHTHKTLNSMGIETENLILMVLIERYTMTWIDIVVLTTAIYFVASYFEHCSFNSTETTILQS